MLLSGKLVVADARENCFDRMTCVVCKTHSDEGVHHLSGVSQIGVETLWSHEMHFGDLNRR